MSKESKKYIAVRNQFIDHLTNLTGDAPLKEDMDFYYSLIISLSGNSELVKRSIKNIPGRKIMTEQKYLYPKDTADMIVSQADAIFMKFVKER